MAERRPTPPQVQVLQAAADGILSRLDLRGYRPIRSDGKPVRKAVVDACFDADWVRLEGRRQRLDAIRPRIVLTDLGAAVLARHNARMARV